MINNTISIWFERIPRRGPNHICGVYHFGKITVQAVHQVAPIPSPSALLALTDGMTNLLYQRMGDALVAGANL